MGNSYDLPAVQKEFQQAFVSAEGQLQKAQNDLNQKKVLVGSLNTSNSKAFRQNRTQIQQHLKTMESRFQDITKHQRAMSEANSHIASMTYARQKVYNHEPEYKRVDDLVKQFKSAAAGLNTAATEYAKSSNALIDFVSLRKLYFILDTNDFQQRVRDNIKLSQENAHAMQIELNRAADILLGEMKGQKRPAAENLVSDMNQLASKYTHTAGELAGFSQAMLSVAQGQVKVSSADEQWNEVQKIAKEWERAIAQLNQLNNDFKKKVNALRSLMAK